MSKFPFTTKQFWKDRLKEYDGNYYDAVQAGGVAWDKIEETHGKIFKEHLKGRVLDVGCGFGRIIPLLPDEVTEYVGIDISPDFLKKARKDFPGYKFIEGDARRLPFKDKEFDWTVAIGMGGHKEEGISDFFTVVKSEMERVSKNTLVMWLSRLTEFDVYKNNTYLSQ